MSALVVFTLPMFGQGTAAIAGYCSLGGTSAKVQGTQSTNTLQGIVPSCAVTVYLTGTQTKATIFKDAIGTTLPNPFTANATNSVNPGAWLFYAATGQGYDIVMSGGIPPNTYTQPVTLTDQFSGGGSGGGGGPTNSCQFNNEFWVAGCSVGSATLCPNGGTTQLECAANAANAWSNNNGSNTIIHLMPGVNSTNSGLRFTNTYAPSIVGDATFGSLIRQTSSISSPVVSYGCNVFASSVTLKDFQIDADFNAPSALYIGKNQVYSFDGVTLLGAVGTGSTSNFVQFGDSTCGGGGGATFEGHIKHLTVTGRGTGPTSWAQATCSQTGGIPSCSISNGGTYHWNTSTPYLVGYQNGTSKQACTVMGTVTPTFTQNGTWQWGETFYTQTLPTYTLASVALTGFSGCSGSLYLFVPDELPPAYGLYLPFATDTVFDMLVVAGAGQTAGVVNMNTADVFHGLHIYNNHVGFQAIGGGYIDNYDCDSNLIMMQVVGAVPLQERGCAVFYPSAALSKFNGAVIADLSADTGHQSSFVQNTVVDTSTDWHAFLQSNGPTDQTGNWPGSLIENGSPTLNPFGNVRHDTSMNAVLDVVGSEIPATASANQNSPFRAFCANVWNGSGTEQHCWTMQYTTSASGVPSQEILNITPPSNALAPISGRFWLFNTPANAMSGSNFNSITLGLRGSYWNGSAAVSFGWNFTSSTGSGTTPNVNLNINPSSACPGTCAINTNVLMSAAGFQINNTAPSAGHYLRGAGGAGYVDGTIQQSDLPNTSPQTSGTPAAGHAGCIKSAGPPVVIGYCSTQPDSSGACTCN
jgi:hypothetical protein